MKVAELPDGNELYFPPDYPDDKMDKAVLEYIKMQQSNNQEQIEEMRALRETIKSGVDKIATIMAAPKILERDWQDRPIGVKPKLEGQ
jgi:hypothetical protein